ncbi:hypothetical protein ACOSQ2_028680 [Xanthoceras sorbifolium]
MVWSRGLWHFDKNLIVIEKPVGPEETSAAKPKAYEDFEDVVGAGAEGANRIVITAPTSSDKLEGKSNRDIEAFPLALNSAVRQKGGILTQDIQLGDHPSREALARMDEEIVGSNLCDEGDVVMFGSSLGKPSSKKWKRLIRGSPLQKLILGCPSPIQKMLLARHYARRECYSVICSTWGGFDSDTSGRGLRDKLAVCADRLENWSKVKFGSLRKAINRKRCELNLLYDRQQSEQVLNDIKLRERELESLLSNEELYWKQRSRVDWLLAGDKNSKFFHRRATARKKKNMISSLVDDRGIRRESEQGMSNVVFDYFSDLFKPFSNAPVDDLMVAALISPSSHSWDLAKLDHVFVAADRDSILEIPLSFGDCNDSLIWHFDKNGEYSFCMILWGVWSERNAVCHSKSPRFSADLVSWSLSLLREFQGTQKVFGSSLQPPRQPRSSP